MAPSVSPAKRKVLYLPQPSFREREIAAFTFLSEEIHALAAAGVEAYVVSPYVGEDHDDGNIRLRRMPSARSWREIRSTLAFLHGHRGLVPKRSLVRPFHCLHTLRIERFAADLVRRYDIDLIHSHFGYPNGYGGMLAARETGRPLVSSLRGMDLLMDRSIASGLRLYPWYDRAIRTHVREADWRTCVSEFMRQEAIRLGAPPERTTTILKGVDLGRFSPDADAERARSRLGLRGGPVILTVAGLIRRKGVDVILNALALLRAQYDFQFVVCGDGPEHNRLRSLCRSLGLQGQTRFVGKVERDLIQDYFAACDVFVLASVQEASGNVLCEAMAAGRPVVCTDSGGPPEYVLDGETGLVVPVKEPRALSSAIRRLLADPDLRARFGRAGRARAESHHAYDRMVNEILGVYAGLVREPRPAVPAASTRA